MTVIDQVFAILASDKGFNEPQAGVSKRDAFYALLGDSGKSDPRKRLTIQHANKGI